VAEEMERDDIKHWYQKRPKKMFQKKHSSVMNLITEWDPEVLPGTEENLGD
jgi:hypothetical protein